MMTAFRTTAALVGLLLLALPQAVPFARVNKYAQFSKAEQVRRTLKTTNPQPSGDAQPEQQLPRTRTTQKPQQRASWAYPDAAQIDQRDPTTFGFSEIGVVLGAHGTRGELKVASDSDFAQERLCMPGRTWLRRAKRRAPREAHIVRGRKGPGTDNFLVVLDGVESREEAAALRGATLFIRRELRPSLEGDEMMLWELEGLTVALGVREGSSMIHHDSDNSDGDGTSGGEAIRWAVGETVGTVTGVVPREELTGSRTLGNDLLEVTIGGEQAEEEERERESAERGCSAHAEGDDNAVMASEGAQGDTVLVPFVPQIVVDIRLGEAPGNGIVLLDPPPGLLELVQPKRSERVVIRGLLTERAASLEARERDDV
jgi:16S rRNA processing protein RimM